MEDLTIGLDTFLKNGGIASIFIILAAGLLILVGVERVFVLFKTYNINVLGALEQVRGLILEKKYTDAIQVCNKVERSPELSVAKTALLAVETGREAMKSSIGAELLQVNQKCEKRLSFIALIASVSTLLGLLGTIMGLIKTFNAIREADASQKAELLGAGISEAMLSTVAGLSVGICALVLHSLCSSKANGIVSQSQDAGLKVISWVEQAERT